MTKITREDALLAIDGAMAALASARVLVSAIGEEPVDVDGVCQHVRTADTFTGVMCRDCGATLGVPTAGEADSVSTLSTEEAER